MENELTLARPKQKPRGNSKAAQEAKKRREASEKMKEIWRKRKAKAAAEAAEADLWFKDIQLPAGLVLRQWLKRCTHCGRHLTVNGSYWCTGCGQLSG
jgi:uncharacterized Fe-S radical SAM superfamily protein PflX